MGAGPGVDRLADGLDSLTLRASWLHIGRDLEVHRRRSGRGRASGGLRWRLRTISWAEVAQSPVTVSGVLGAADHPIPRSEGASKYAEWQID